jgi:hypothetical protein
VRCLEDLIDVACITAVIFKTFIWGPYCCLDLISHTHKQNEGRAPVWGSEFTTKSPPRGGVQKTPLLGLNKTFPICLVPTAPSGTIEPIRNSCRLARFEFW